MKNCDTCINFIKVKYWHDGRKGLCNFTDYNIENLKGKPCKYYRPKKTQGGTVKNGYYP